MFTDHFRCAVRDNRRGRSIWYGVWERQALIIRTTRRTLYGGESFMTSSNERLANTRTGDCGFFVDAEIVKGRLTPDQLERLGRLMAEAGDANEPVRVRNRGDTFRRGVFAEPDRLVFPTGKTNRQPKR